MGKSRRNKRNNVKGTNPVGAEVREVEVDEGEDILKQLTNPNWSTRVSALTTVSLLTAQPDHARKLKPELVKTVAPLILDENASVRNAAAGALRSLSAVHDICGVLVKENVMVGLETVVGKYAEWNPQQKPDKKDKDKEKDKEKDKMDVDEGTPAVPAQTEGEAKEKLDNETDTMTMIVATLWNLCESSPTALKILTKQQMHLQLLRYLDWNVFGIRLASAVAHLLLAATEDNKLSNANNISSQLTTALESASAPPALKILLIGILGNLNSTHPVSTIPTITEVLQSSPHDLCKKFSSQIPVDKDMDIKLDSTIEDIISDISNVKTAMEILSNMLSGDDDDSDFSDIDDEMEIEADAAHIDIRVIEGLPNFLPSLVSLCKPLPVNVEDLIKNSDYKRLLKSFNSMRTTAMLTLQNLYEAVPLDLMEKAVKSKELFNTLTTYSGDEESIVEAATCLIRSILQQWVNANLKETFPVLPFAELYSKIPLLKTRINIIKILGLTTVMDPTVLKDVGLFFLNCIEGTKTSLYLLSELLDTIMDVFAEDETDDALKSIGLNLSPLVSDFKRLGKSELKKSLRGEERAVVETVMENLGPFIVYKGKRGIVL